MAECKKVNSRYTAFTEYSNKFKSSFFLKSIINKSIAAFACVITIASITQSSYAASSSNKEWPNHIQNEDNPKEAKGFYLKAAGGANALKSVKKYKFDPTPLYKVGAGYHFNDVFRIDIDARYSKLEAKKRFASLSSIKTTSKINHIGAMLNGYVNLTDSQDNFIPYLTAGIGYGRNKLTSFVNTSSGGSSISQTGKSKSSMLWGVGAGGIIKLNKTFGLDLGYKYTNLGKVRGTTNITDSLGSQIPGTINIKNLYSHEVSLGFIINL